MRTFTIDEMQQRKEEIIKMMRSQVFVYPTDTVYSLGCNAMIHKSVQRVRDIKSSFKLPFAVIVPSVQWIEENCVVPDEAKEALADLPNASTLVFKLKDTSVVDEAVLSGKDSISVRIPNHWISSVVAELGYPIVTTSANLMGEPVMTHAEEMHETIKAGIDFCVDEGEIKGIPPKVLKFN